jgi:rubrerythrin
MIEDITLKGCMEFAVATEELGTRFYTRAASRFQENEAVHQIFTQLAQDEEVHRRQFAELLRRTPPEEGVSSSPEKIGYLRAMSISEFFSHREGPFTDIKEVGDRDEALKTALEFEKATLGFYKAVEDHLGQIEPLSQVIEAEKGHVDMLLRALLVEGSKFRSLQDRWP